jgi:hypothetical protein
MIDKFVTFKEPVVVEDRFENDTLVHKGGIIFRSHVVMTDGRHYLISDSQHGSGRFAIDETMVFPCDEDGNVASWEEGPWGGREMRTEQVVAEMNKQET